MTVAIDFSTLGAFPTDCTGQSVYITQLETLLNVLKNYVDASVQHIIILEQSVEPSQAQWEAAWTAQTGLALPIPANAVLLWYDDYNSTLGGVYGTVTGYTTVEKREAEYIPGTTLLWDTVRSTSTVANTLSLYENAGNLPSIAFTTPVVCNVEFKLSIYIGITSGSGQWSVDFMIDGVKVGTEFLNILPNDGIANGLGAQERVTLFWTYQNLPAGDHTLNILAGVGASPATPPTVSIGTTSNVTSLEVKAVVA